MNWAERIQAAKANGDFAIGDQSLAHHWDTCACSEQDSRIPQDPLFRNRKPDDQELSDYGFDFYTAIAHNAPYMAGELLDKIETRAAQILAGLGETA